MTPSRRGSPRNLRLNEDGVGVDGEAALRRGRRKLDTVHEADAAKQVDDRVGDVELARAQGLDVKKLVARTEVEDRTLDLADALARLEKSRRDAEVVKTDLGYAVIRAPITGTIASVTTQTPKQPRLARRDRSLPLRCCPSLLRSPPLRCCRSLLRSPLLRC